MTYGMSRDDAGPFLMPYIAQEITKEDSTVSIDQTGALRLMQICLNDARKVNPNIKLGTGANRAGKGQRPFLQLAGFDVCLVQPKARAGGEIGGGV